MIVSYKFRLRPSKTQISSLNQAFGCARVLYNACLDWWKNEYKTAKSEERKMNKLPLVTFFKQKYQFLSDVDSLALMNARKHFMKAMDNFFEAKKGNRPYVGFPVFKKRNIHDSFTTNNQDGTVRIYGGKVKLPKLGYIRFDQHRKITDGKIMAATVSKNSVGKFFISISVNTDLNVPIRENDKERQKVVGLDMSLSDFVVSSDASDEARTKFVRTFRLHEGKIARLSRRLSRKDKGSNNREKARVRLSREYEKTSNIRHDFVVKTALHFARSYDIIVIEDINMGAMSRCLNLGKSVMDLGFGEFKQWLKWQCFKHGSQVVVADKWFPSSKTCNHCGSVNKGLTLSDREWVCPECGAVISRDYNAACNLRDWYFKNYNTAGTAGINACGDSASTMGETPSQVESAKQEAPSFREG